MTTLIIDIKDRSDAGIIAEALRLMRGVSKITIKEEEAFEYIPGLPYTQKERMTAIRRAEEDYVAGRFTTSEKMKVKHPRV